jgi:hypothetical protein
MSTELEAATPGAEQFAAQVRQIAEFRQRENEVNNRIEEAQVAFQESIKALIEEAEQLRSQRESAEGMLRASALAHYEQTKVTKPTAGVQVKLFTQLEYDLEKADKWTRERGIARIPEQLDQKAFEKIAKATSISFVVEKKVPKVTIATNLEKALSEAAQ